MSSSGYTPWAVTLGEQPTTAYWNILGSNDASFNNGNGISDGAIINRHYGMGSITAPKMATGGVDFNALNGEMAFYGTGSRLITGINDPGSSGMFVVQSATYVTDAGQQEMRINFPYTFPNGLLSVIASQGDFTQGALICTRAYDLAGFNVIYPGGTIVRTNYIAIGW